MARFSAFFHVLSFELNFVFRSEFPLSNFSHMIGLLLSF